jgi:N utilization substance protein B
LGIPEGTQLPTPIIEFYYKDDALGDPLVTEDHVVSFDWMAPEELDIIRQLTFRINDFLEHYAINKSLDKITDLNIEQDDREFVVELFQYTMDRQDEFSTLVEPKLENWDMERIAILDLIIMKMALCELLYFPMIPVKVTINEYIEIAKLYSTPKSKDFVNGVLDKIMKELKESGAIKKSGRGLQG